MPSVVLNKKILEKHIGTKLPLAKLKENITYLGTDLEKIEGDEIHVEIFPNRPDMLSEQGLARALSSFCGVKTGLQEYTIHKADYKAYVDKSVISIGRTTACAVIKNLKFTDELIREIIQIQEKLHVTYGRNRKKVAIGIYPLEHIQFPVTYKALAKNKIQFQPLETDRSMGVDEILENHPTGKAYAHLLEGAKLYPVWVDAKNYIMSLTPIINSRTVGKVTEKTRDVFIECTGPDYITLAKCISMLVTTLSDMGGEIYSIETHYPDKKIISPDLKPTKMKLDSSYVTKRLGIDLNEKEIKILLEKMGFGYEKGTVFVPAYRTDILHQIDFVEDIAIAYGYNKIKAEIPHVATIAKEDSFEIYCNRLTELLVGYGLLETKPYHLVNQDLNTHMCVELDQVSIENPSTQEYDTLRAWLIPSLMDVLKNNRHHEFPHTIFTIGTVFKKNPKYESRVEEFRRLAVTLCDTTIDLTAIKQLLDYIMRMLDLDYETKEADHPSFIKGRCARIYVKGKAVAYLGEISPQVLSNFELEYPVVALELNVTELFR